MRKAWLLTMFEKKNSALDNTTDTGKTLTGNGNDTATPESTVVSEDKDSDISSLVQEKTVKVWIFQNKLLTLHRQPT